MVKQQYYHSEEQHLGVKLSMEILELLFERNITGFDEKELKILDPTITARVMSVKLSKLILMNYTFRILISVIKRKQTTDFIFPFEFSVLLIADKMP